jgi:hypothetical protein
MSKEMQGDGSPLGAADIESVPGGDAEIARLRRLIGADEYSYTELKLELWTVRDLFIGMEAELGTMRGRCRLLERRVEELQRELEDEHDAQSLGAPPGSGSLLRGKVRAVRARIKQL